MTPEVIALAWLLLLCGIGLGYFGWLFKHSDYSTWESCLYLPTYLFGRLLWRVHFTNSAPGELRGGGVMAANHRSSVDPFFVQLAARRRVHWMVAQEYCRHFAFGEQLKQRMCWLPDWQDARQLLQQMGVSSITVAQRLIDSRAIENNMERLELYRLIEEQLTGGM